MGQMVSPRWRIWVDWNGNGTWGESSGAYREEVTEDVLDLEWRWGKRAGISGTRRRMPPAELNLTLGNGDQQYTPGNSQSPLHGHLNAGKRVWAAFAWPLDDFQGTNGRDLNGRAAPVGEGAAWSKASTGPAGVVVEQGMAKPASGGGGAIYTLDFGEADAHVGFIFRRSSNGGSGVALRVASQWDYLRVSFRNDGTVLEDVTFGFPSFLRRGDPLAADRDYFIEIAMHGSSVRLFATDLSQGSADRKTILDGGGNAGNATATRHGLWHDGSAAATADRWGQFGGWRSFFYGSVARLSPERDPELGYVCRITARDDLHLLAQWPLYNLFNQSPLSTGSLANSILTWAGFSPSHRRLDQGQTLVATEPRAMWRISAERALAGLAEEENGRIYLDGRGYVQLEDAGHRNAGPHAAARVTLRDTSGSGPYFSELVWDDGNDGVENSVAFRYRLATSRGPQEIWQLRDVPAIPAGATRDFLAESDRYEVVDSFQAPAANSDYTANSRPDGRGDDMTDSVTVSLPYAPGGSLAAPSDRYRGRGTVVRVTNDHASATAYLTLLRLMADRTYEAPEPTSYRAEDTASQSAHGLRDAAVECRFIDNYAAARVGAEARLADGSRARARLVLTLPNGGGANLAQMAHRVLSDRIRVVSGSPRVDGDFFIEGMEIIARARTGEMVARWLAVEV